MEVLCGDFSSISLANDVSKNDMDRVHVLLSHPGMNGATLDLVKGLQYQCMSLTSFYFFVLINY